MLGLIKVNLGDTDTHAGFLSREREDCFDKLIMNLSFFFIQTMYWSTSMDSQASQTKEIHIIPTVSVFKTEKVFFNVTLFFKQRDDPRCFAVKTQITQTSGDEWNVLHISLNPYHHLTSSQLWPKIVIIYE